MSKVPIPLNSPSLVGREMEYLMDAVARRHLAGSGYYTSACEELLENELKVPRVFLTTSGTHALEMAAMLMDRGDDGPRRRVIMPTFTFSSTANAFLLRGFTPSFCDVDDTLNLDLDSYEPICGEDAAIVPIHYGGVAANMSKVEQFAESKGLAIVEDAAHALFGRYRERYLGTFGKLAAFSFHETKNFQCGEGGALVVNDSSMVEAAEQIRDKGTSRPSLLRGEINEYSWKRVGSSYAPSEILAAFLFAQLQGRQKVENRRRYVYCSYARAFANLSWASIPIVPEDCSSTYHVFYLLVHDESTRDRIILELGKKGVKAAFHYLPLHESTMGKQLGYRADEFPKASSMSRRIVRLPNFYEMTRLQVERVIDAVLELNV